ncbi:FAD binding domain-containing protein [Thalassiella azotivora]
MKPSPLRYHRPTSLPQALEVLAGLGDEGKVLAGGQSLVPLMSMRLAAPPVLVDVNAVPGLDAVEVTDDVVRVGALVRHRALERHDGAHAAQPLLRRALEHVAHPTIRNRGTTVGSVAHADPSAEMPAVMTLLRGHVVARSATPGQPAERRIAASDFFLGPLESELRPDELAVAIEVPVARPGEGTALVEIARRHGDYAVVGVVARAVVTDGVVRSLEAAYVSAGDGAVVDLSDGVTGREPGEVDVRTLGERARELVETEADIHATAAYRSQLVQVLTRRAVEAALADATGANR